MRPALVAVLFVATTLGGCGSDDENEDPAPINEDTVELSQYGVIRVAYDSGALQTQLDAVFCSLSNPASASSIDNQFLSPSDSCVVSNGGEADNGAVGELSCGDALSTQTISAGDNLLVASADGSYADLSKQQSDDAITYTAGVSLPRPPDGLTLDIPGDDFPQFSSVAVPDLEDLEISSPAAGEPVTSAVDFRWTAASDRSNSRVLLSASNAGVTVTCSLADDGRFSFSTATQAEMGELFAADSFTVRRQNFVSPTRGDSGLVIITSIQ